MWHIHAVSVRKNYGTMGQLWDELWEKKGIDIMERTTPVEPIEVKGYQVDHNYKK